MSFNDRCGEAYEILRHGGTIPDTPEVRAAILDYLHSGKEGWRFPDRDFVYAVLDHPENAELRAQTSDGEWYGPEDEADRNEDSAD
ncbi:hypothetical protein [Aeromicrobium sp. 179-A 4D2 NHS]|uniref:hypothetical protein n=1 Tax=Aeromicrobium sp. 179-A 4D2 NHS TaxID=3142375 RepID=UPI00399FFA44